MVTVRSTRQAKLPSRSSCERPLQILVDPGRLGEAAIVVGDLELQRGDLAWSAESSARAAAAVAGAIALLQRGGPVFRVVLDWAAIADVVIFKWGAYMTKAVLKASLRAAVLFWGFALYATAGPGDSFAAGSPFFPPFGIDLSARDPSTRPQDDFFQYVNGAWLARTPIPADQSSVTMGRDVANRVEARLHTFLGAAAAPGAVGLSDDETKVGAMYAAFMDAARIDALGVTPIVPLLDRVRGAKDRDALARLMGESAYDFGSSFFSIYIDADLKDPAHYAVYLSQNGLGMPDRDYYLKPEFAAQKVAYQAYVARLLTLVGWREPEASAAAVVALETAIAEASWTKAEQRDLPRLYNPASPAELAALAPGFPWKPFLERREAGRQDPRDRRGEDRLSKDRRPLCRNAPLDVLKAWSCLQRGRHRRARLCPSRSRTPGSSSGTRTLSGQPAPQPRWKRAIAAVSGGDCGATAGNVFRNAELGRGPGLRRPMISPPRRKPRCRPWSRDLIAAFRGRIERLDWMSPSTKAEALKKLDTYTVKIGYPDHPRDYSAVVIRRDDLVGDVRRAAAADWAFYVDRSAVAQWTAATG